MSLSITPGTSFFTSTNKNFTGHAIHPSDVAITTDEPNEVVYTSKVTPVDQSTTVKYGLENIKNIYSGTSVDPSVMLPSKQGFSLVAQLKDIVRVTDGTPNGTFDMPISAHIVLRAPKSQYLSTELLESELKYLLGSLCKDTDGESEGDSITRLDSLIRGALKDILS